MRILIADDEILTRNGLVSKIDWDMLGIHQIDQAEDGVKGLILAKANMPDIVLTDVRMPRMDGIQMAEAIQSENNDCRIIFMSGYSDKEYLKAAIKLHAVRYVEKPINIEEITEALQEASDSIAKLRLERHSKYLLEKETASRIALNLTQPNYVLPEEYYSMINISPKHTGSFTTIIVKLLPSLAELSEETAADYMADLDQIFKRHNLYEIHTYKHGTFLIIHSISNSRIDTNLLLKISEEIRTLFQDQQFRSIHIGKTVHHAEKLYNSYNSAVVLVQSSFFYENGAILSYEDNVPVFDKSRFDSVESRFSSAIQNNDFDTSIKIATECYETLRYNRTLLPDTVKETYYKMLSDINKAIYNSRLLNTLEDSNHTGILSAVSACSTLTELHEMLLKKIQSFKDRLNSSAEAEENPTIFLIKDYISKNYSNMSLSIKDISDHVHLSTSYLCTVFKTETGQTLNQYITNYRMERAKLLLEDPRNRISEISSMVGYADGNYFGKSFKKVVGLSPSEYRECELS